MTEHSEKKEGALLALPDTNSLAAIFVSGKGLDPLLSQLEKAAREEAKCLDLTTRKNRDALKSLAYKISQSKAELDRQGLALTEEARKKIDGVNDSRKAIKDRLDRLRDEIRDPVIKWEASEKERKAKHQEALKAFDQGRVDAMSDSQAIRAVIDEVEKIETGERWDEYQPTAEAFKEKALGKFRNDLSFALKREKDAAELARLRAEAEERERIEAEERAAQEAAATARQKAEAEKKRQKDLADRLIAYCKEAARGMIDGQPQPLAILMHDLENRIRLDEAAAGGFWPHVDIARRKALARLKEAQAEHDEAARVHMEREKAEAAERAAREAEQRAAKEKREAEERHAREIAEAKAREERAAQAERARIEQEAKAREEEARQRADDQAHRERILEEIRDAMAPIPREDIPLALLDGRIPHVKVML